MRVEPGGGSDVTLTLDPFNPPTQPYPFLPRAQLCSDALTLTQGLAMTRGS